MTKIENLVGRKFGKYTVIAETNKRCPTKFVCKCECGKIVEVRSGDLKNGHSNGCNKCSQITHGMSGTRIYKIWKDMKSRCFNKNMKSFVHYGERGITVCGEWKESFINFKEWAFENGYKEDLTIDRIDVNGNYEPNNCRWATTSLQNSNKRRKQYEIGGVVKTFPQWCEYADLSYNLVYQRVHTVGETLERALRLDEK